MADVDRTVPALTDPLAPAITDIKAALSDRINEGADADSFAQVLHVHGLETVIANCCPGLGWVRLTSSFPSVSFPSPDTRRSNCGISSFAANFEIGVARCIDVPDGPDMTIPHDVVETEAEQYGRDRSALLQTVLCDLPPLFDNEVVLERWTPLDSIGGCMASIVTFTIPYDQCCDELA